MSSKSTVGSQQAELVMLGNLNAQIINAFQMRGFAMVLWIAVTMRRIAVRIMRNTDFP